MACASEGNRIDAPMKAWLAKMSLLSLLVLGVVVTPIWIGLILWAFYMTEQRLLG